MTERAMMKDKKETMENALETDQRATNKWAIGFEFLVESTLILLNVWNDVRSTESLLSCTTLLLPDCDLLLLEIQNLIKADKEGTLDKEMQKSARNEEAGIDDIIGSFGPSQGGRIASSITGGVLKLINISVSASKAAAVAVTVVGAAAFFAPVSVGFDMYNIFNQVNTKDELAEHMRKHAIQLKQNLEVTKQQPIAKLADLLSQMEEKMSVLDTTLIL
jgi:hypothetical protein